MGDGSTQSLEILNAHRYQIDLPEKKKVKKRTSHMMKSNKLI